VLSYREASDAYARFKAIDKSSTGKALNSFNEIEPLARLIKISTSLYSYQELGTHGY